MYLNQFNGAPPGHSLTQPKGKWPWDKPPVFTTPVKATSFIIDKLEEPAIAKGYLKMMLAGVSIEDITQSIVMGGFAKGYFNPDIAELIKMPIAFYFMGMAHDNNIPVRVFSDTPEGLAQEDDGMDDQSLLDAVRLQNPQIYSAALERGHQEMRRTETRQQGMLGVSMSPEMMMAGPEMPAQEDMFEGPDEMEEEA